EVDTRLVRPLVVVEPDQGEGSLLGLHLRISGPDRIPPGQTSPDVCGAMDVRLRRGHPPTPDVRGVLRVEVLRERVRAEAHDALLGELPRVCSARFSGTIESSEHRGVEAGDGVGIL